MAYHYSYDNESKEVKRAKLKTDRSILKFAVLNILTCGLYSIIFFMPFSYDLDMIAPKRDGTKTISFILIYILSLFTGSIPLYVWIYHITERAEEALGKRNFISNFGTSTFWTWYVFGSLIIVGPYVYFHKLFKVMNLLCEDYNKEHNL